MHRFLTITKRYDFDAAHRLDRLPASHKCHRLHGHTYACEVEVEGEVDGRLQWICDYAVVDRAWSTIHDALDHRLLNEIEGLEVPTTEVLAVWIGERLLPQLPDGVRLVSITVHESSATRARCRFV